MSLRCSPTAGRSSKGRVMWTKHERCMQNTSAIEVARECAKLQVDEEEHSMTQIFLTEEQANIVARALEPVQVCDRNGRILASITPVWTEEDIAEAKRRGASCE